MENLIFLLIIPICLVSYSGLKDVVFKEKYIFNTDEILINKEYFRLITSGFLHANWLHLAFNMLALSSFGSFIIIKYGLINFSLLFLGSLLGGSLLSLFIHRNHENYRALGASGAVSGIIFSTIVSEPFSKVSFLLLPAGFPAWGIGIAYIIISIYGIKKNNDNIGHDAHLGGAVFGIIGTLFINPQSFSDNFWVYALLGIPSIGFILFIVKNPTYLMFDSLSINSYIPKTNKVFKEVNNEEEVNRILDIINKDGIEKLSKRDKNKLDNLSKK